MLRGAVMPAFLVVLVQSASHARPVTKTDAEASRLRLKKVKAFAEGHVDLKFANSFNAGLANAKAFEANCKNKVCKEATMNKPDGVCCSDGENTCKNDAKGEELKDKCHTACLNQKNVNSDASLKEMCSPKTFKKSFYIAVCGTGKGRCFKCMAGQVALPAYNSEKENCERAVLCTKPTGSQATPKTNCNAACYRTEASGKQTHDGGKSRESLCKPHCTELGKDKTTCPNGMWANYTWVQPTSVPAKYMEITAATDKAKCGKDDKCSRCEGCKEPCPGDKINCQNNAGMCNISTASSKLDCSSKKGIWTPAKWVAVPGPTDSDSCRAVKKGMNMGNANWMEVAKWQKGEEIKDTKTLSKDQKCSTGPSHSEPSHVVKTCASQSIFLAEAQAKDASGSFEQNKTYYDMVHSSVIGQAKVVNAATATTRSSFVLTDKTCFVIISEPENHGRFILNGSDKTFALILNPTNAADADDLEVRGGSAMVLGGSNAGNIKSSTSKSLEVYNLTNSGNLEVSKSEAIIIADVQNKGGAIMVTDVGVTLINVGSSGNITAKGSKGKYSAYNIVNTGKISIDAGTIDLHFTCNAGGIVTIGSSVTGKISYDNVGCKGTITAPAAVKLTNLSPPTTTTTTTTTTTATTTVSTTTTTTATTTVSTKTIGGSTGTTVVAVKKVSGNLKIKVPAASAATFKTDPKVKTALQDAIAGQIAGVDKQMVKILEVIDARRLSASDRLLSTNSSAITVKYEITLPKDVTVSAVTTAMTGGTAKTSLATLVNKELKKQGFSSTITVEETTAMESTPETPHKAASHSAQFPTMFDASVFMSMVGAHFAF